MAAATSRPQILVVDDEAIIAQLISDVLTGDGYDVDTASDGLIALECIGRCGYDLILSDLRMPGLARRFVFITGTSEHTDYAGLLGGLAVPVLTKPFDMSALQRVVREAFAASVS